MPDLIIVFLATFLIYVQQYSLCFTVDRTDIEKHEKKIRLNKYTKKLFFLWNGNEKVHWLVYTIIIIESVLFITIWIFYFLGNVNVFRKVFNMYICVGSVGAVLLVIKIFIRRVKDRNRW